MDCSEGGFRKKLKHLSQGTLRLRAQTVLLWSPAHKAQQSREGGGLSKTWWSVCMRPIGSEDWSDGNPQIFFFCLFCFLNNLLMWNPHNRKWTILRWTIQGHLVYLQCHTTTASIEFQNIFITPNRNPTPIKQSLLIPLPLSQSLAATSLCSVYRFIYSTYFI